MREDIPGLGWWEGAVPWASQCMGVRGSERGKAGSSPRNDKVVLKAVGKGHAGIWFWERFVCSEHLNP